MVIDGKQYSSELLEERREKEFKRLPAHVQQRLILFKKFEENFSGDNVPLSSSSEEDSSEVDSDDDFRRDNADREAKTFCTVTIDCDARYHQVLMHNLGAEIL